MDVRLLCAVALSRPWCAASITATIRRQEYSTAWVVVENGFAAGSFAGSAARIRSSQSAGAARNAALDYARESGFDWVSFFDDDDYYGPEYVAEVAAAVADGNADAFHKGVGFVRFDAGLRLFDSSTRHVMANTLTVRVGVAPHFAEIAEPEEPQWSRIAALRGMRIRQLPPWHHVWDRTGDPARHVFKGGEAAMRTSFGPSTIIGQVPDEFVDIKRRIEHTNVDRGPSADELFRDLERHALAFGWGQLC